MLSTKNYTTLKGNTMSKNLYDIYTDEFQIAAERCLHRNKNILDTITKHEAAAAKVSRAIVKASTQCGCIGLSGKAQESEFTPDIGVSGELCADCRETIESEIGEELFYLACACNALGLSMYDILLLERKKLSLLGKFSLK